MNKRTRLQQKSRFVTARQYNPKRRAAAGFAIHFDPPTVQIDDPPGFRQAQAEAAAGFATTKEWVKNIWPHVSRNAGPGVGDRKDECPGFHRPFARVRSAERAVWS